jgi:hypothetical protein
MKKKAFLFLFLVISVTVFSQSHDLTAFMVEATTGYALGINVDSAMQLSIKIMYPFERFGVALEAGTILTPDKASFHVFLGPMMFFINNENWRIPLAIGFDLFDGETLYYGIGGFISIHRKLTNHFYAGVNLGITYAFNNVYDELTGHRTERVVTEYPAGSGNAVFMDREIPIFERKNHWGSYIYLKPSLLIGFQY